MTGVYCPLCLRACVQHDPENETQARCPDHGWVTPRPCRCEGSGTLADPIKHRVTCPIGREMKAALDDAEEC